MTQRFRALLVGIAISVLAGSTLADEVIFNNGDKLTGTIKQLEGGKLSISSKVAGDIVVDLKDVKTFTTDEPIELHLKDGSVIKQQVAATDGGAIKTAGGGTIQSQTIPVADVTQINPSKPEVKWTGSITLGGLITRGNSNTESANVAIDLVRRAEVDRITADAGYLYGRQENPNTKEKLTTTDNWFTYGKYDYFFTKQVYGFASGRIERDRIASLDLRLTPAVGAGYQWIESPKMNFNTEAGLAWVYEKFSNTDETNDHFAARLAYHFDWAVNDKVTVFHNLEFLPSVEDLSNFNVNTDAGVRAALTQAMFTEFKFEWRYDESPAPGASNSDLRYILGVGWRL